METTISKNRASSDVLFDPLETTITEVFERYVDERPDAATFIDHNGEYSYAQLNADANRIAHAILAEIGEAPANVVVMAENDYSFAKCAMGILKAAKPQATVDTNLPLKTLDAMIRNLDAPLIVTDDAHITMALALQQQLPDIKVINASSLDDDLPDHNPGLYLDPREGTFIGHTSGSTGLPKSVVWNQTAYLISAHHSLMTGEILNTDRLASFSSFAFGAAKSLLFRTRAMGVPYCQYDVKRFGTVGIIDWVKWVQPTIINMRPTLLRTFTSTLPQNAVLDNIRAVHIGGEQPYKRDFNLFGKFFPESAQMTTVLASSETGWMFKNTFSHDSVLEDGPLPPGDPFALATLNVVDDDGNPLPFGVQGNVMIESPVTAMGYYKMPDNVTTRFELVDRHRNIRRLWTSDRGVYHKDGRFVFLGRGDDNVKIRGYRVQLKTVEATMLRLPNISNAAVVPRNAPDTVLVGFYTTENGQPETIANLRRGLLDTLPDYMLPTHYFHLDTMPTMSSGKIDRVGLPEVDLSQRYLSTDIVPPTTPIEEKLVGFYKSVLGVSTVGVTDNFFELGGTSLQASQLMTLIKNEYGVELPTVLLLRGNTVEYLAKVVAQPDVAEWTMNTQFVTLHGEGSRVPLVFVHGREGDVMGARAFLDHLGKDQPIYGIQNIKDSVPVMLNRTAEEVGRTYANMLLSRGPRGPYILMGHSMGGLLVYAMAQELVKMGAAKPEDIMIVMLDTLYSLTSMYRNRMRRGGWRRRVHSALYALLPNQRLAVRRLIIRGTKWHRNLRGKGKLRFLQTWEEKPFDGKLVYVQCTLRPTGKPRRSSALKRQVAYWQYLAEDFTLIKVDSWHEKALWVPGAFEQFAAAFNPILDAFNEQRGKTTTAS